MMPAATGSVRFRPFTPADERHVADIVCDPTVMRFSDNGPLARADVPGWIEKQNRSATHGDRPGFGRWAAVRARDDRVVGYATLSRHEGRVGPGEAEIGFRFAVAYWGQGYATDTARALIAHGFGLPDIERIAALVDPDNLASRRVLEKAGMAITGEIMLPGYDHPDLVYAIDAPA